jgi:hypothetical protein
MEAYRLALFACEVGWYDVTELLKDKRTVGIADQLYRSLGSISANLAEGYSHHTGKSRDWYYKSHHVLKEPVAAHRIALVTQIVKLLLVMVPQQHGKTPTLREESAEYSLRSIQPDEPVPF